MNREILINSDGGETRVAVVEDGRLVELTVERPEAERVAGNVYKAKVENVLPGMQAAFVNIGLEKNAFLYVADAAPVINLEEVEGDAPPKIRKGLAINKLLKQGQKITVQVTKDPIGTKGARVSAYVTLPSHYVVLMPTVDYVGVSRRIGDPKERARLRALATKIKPRGMGLIVRTAAEGHEFEEIQADVNYLAGLYKQIQTRGKSGTAPRVLHQDLGLVGRVVRDVLNESVTRLIVDSAEEYLRVKDLLEAVAPTLKDRVELHDRSAGELFAVHGIEAELDRALARRVWLKNGGYLVIDETEAFTVFDVNTGRYVGSTSLAQTVLDTNLEAAMEIARQLRLRDIGGIIIIDFIDMDQVEHRQRVLQRFDEHLRRDRTRSHVLGITELGLLEMTRKKVRQSLGDTLTKICPTCEGRGRVLSEETVAARIRREIRELLRSSKAHALLAEIHPSVAALMTGSGGQQLRELERELSKVIYIRGSEELSQEGFRFRLFDTQAEVQAVALPVGVGDVVELRVEERHVSNRRDGVARLDGFVLDIEDGGERVGERVKIEVTKVHRTFARARIINPAGKAVRGPQPSQPKQPAQPAQPEADKKLAAAAASAESPAKPAASKPAQGRQVPAPSIAAAAASGQANGAAAAATEATVSAVPVDAAVATAEGGADKAKQAAAAAGGAKAASANSEGGAATTGSGGSRRSRSRRRRAAKAAQSKAETGAAKDGAATDGAAKEAAAAEQPGVPATPAKTQTTQASGQGAAAAKQPATAAASADPVPTAAGAGAGSEHEVAAAAESPTATKRKSRRRRSRRKKPATTTGEAAAAGVAPLPSAPPAGDAPPAGPADSKPGASAPPLSQAPSAQSARAQDSQSEQPKGASGAAGQADQAQKEPETAKAAAAPRSRSRRKPKSSQGNEAPGPKEGTSDGDRDTAARAATVLEATRDVEAQRDSGGSANAPAIESGPNAGDPPAEAAGPKRSRRPRRPRTSKAKTEGETEGGAVDQQEGSMA